MYDYLEWYYAYLYIHPTHSKLVYTLFDQELLESQTQL
jgi:hypothetical protein